MSRAIICAICAISASLMPRVVTAGVPKRMPLVSFTDWVSKGMVFLFAVMFAISSSSCTSMPVRPLLITSTSIR